MPSDTEVIHLPLEAAVSGISLYTKVYSYNKTVIIEK